MRTECLKDSLLRRNKTESVTTKMKYIRDIYITNRQKKCQTDIDRKWQYTLMATVQHQGQDI